MAAVAEPVPDASDRAETLQNASANCAELGSGDSGSPASVNGTVALVEKANVPKAEKQTAEHVTLDDDSTKCCLLQ